MSIDRGKSQALLEWVNALCVAENVESLKQLNDAVHFCKMIELLDKDQRFENEDVNERFKFVINTIETLYQVSMLGMVDGSLIIEKSDEFEISKIALLLLCLGVMSENNTLFLEPAMKLDMNMQLEIREMVEVVMQPERETKSLEITSAFSRVLLSKGPVSAMARPQMSSTPQTPGNMSTMANNMGNNLPKTPIQNNKSLSLARGYHDTPVFSNSIQASSSILGRFYSPQVSIHSACMSPVQQLVNSPGMSNKIYMRQKDHRIKRLMQELNAERYTRTDLEEQIKLKEVDNDRKDVVIGDLQQQLVVTKRENIALKECRESTLMNRDDNEIHDLKQRRSMLAKESKDLKERNVYVESENLQLHMDCNKLKEQVKKLDAFRAGCGEDKKRIGDLENYITDLNEDLQNRIRVIQALTDANQVLETDLHRTQELHKQQQIEWRRAMEISVQNESGECLQEVMEKQLSEQIELLQDSLKTEQGLKAQLKDQVEILEVSITSEKGQKLQMNEQLESLKLSFEEQQRARSELEQRIQTMSQEIEIQRQEWQRHTENQAQEFQSLKSSAESEKAHLQQASSKWQQTAEGVLNELQKEQAEWQMQSQALNQQLQDQQADAAAERISLQEACGGWKNQAETVASELQELRAESEAEKSTLQEMCSTWQERAETVANQLQTRQADWEKQHGEMDKQITTLSQDKIKFGEATNELVKELQTMKELHAEDKNQLKSRINSLEEDLSSAKEENSNVEKCLEMQMHEKTQYQQTCVELQERLTSELQAAEEKNMKMLSELNETKNKSQKMAEEQAKQFEMLMMMEATIKESRDSIEKQNQQHVSELQLEKEAKQRMQAELNVEKEDKQKIHSEYKEKKAELKKKKVPTATLR